MPIDIEKLRRFQIPSVTQTLHPKELALYSLSVGLGADSRDPGQLRFVDPLQGPSTNPAMALVLGEPAGWIEHPDVDVDAASALHLDQALEVFALPVKGEEVTSHSRVTDVFDKGPGRAALIRVVTDLHSARGLLARRVMTIFIRDGGGFGGEAPVDEAKFETAITLPDWQVDLPTRPEQALLYRLNGDLNPLHCDPEVAARAGFEAPILHGLCTLGIAIHAILRAVANYDPHRIRSVRARFARPVFPGETIRTEMWRDGYFRARVLGRDVVVLDNGRFDATNLNIP